MIINTKNCYSKPVNAEPILLLSVLVYEIFYIALPKILSIAAEAFTPPHSGNSYDEVLFLGVPEYCIFGAKLVGTGEVKEVVLREFIKAVLDCLNMVMFGCLLLSNKHVTSSW